MVRRQRVRSWTLGRSARARPPARRVSWGVGLAPAAIPPGTVHQQADRSREAHRTVARSGRARWAAAQAAGARALDPVDPAGRLGQEVSVVSEGSPEAEALVPAAGRRVQEPPAPSLGRPEQVAPVAWVRSPEAGAPADLEGRPEQGVRAGSREWPEHGGRAAPGDCPELEAPAVSAAHPQLRILVAQALRPCAETVRPEQVGPGRLGTSPLEAIREACQ
jgi:hypothetical protein